MQPTTKQPVDEQSRKWLFKSIGFFIWSGARFAKVESLESGKLSPTFYHTLNQFSNFEPQGKIGRLFANYSKCKNLAKFVNRKLRLKYLKV